MARVRTHEARTIAVTALCHWAIQIATNVTDNTEPLVFAQQGYPWMEEMVM